MKKMDFFILGHNRVWRTYTGGLMLERLAGVKDGCDSHFPEDWIASLTPARNIGREELPSEGIAKISLPGGKQVLLSDLVASEPDFFLGTKHYNSFGKRFGFLVKFLDSAVRLHIQAHPDKTFARKYLNSSFGKTEAYYILSVRDEVDSPNFLIGFKLGVDKKSFRKAVYTQSIKEMESMLTRVAVKPGECYLIPPGIPHAIGEGILMLEIMEDSDWAVRCEFEKCGYCLPEQARFMGLDPDLAMDVFSYPPVSESEVFSRLRVNSPVLSKSDGFCRELLIGAELTDCFQVERWTISGKQILPALHSLYIAVVIQGRGMVSTPEAASSLEFFSRFLVPFAAGKLEIEASDSELQLLVCLPPAGGKNNA